MVEIGKKLEGVEARRRRRWVGSDLGREYPPSQCGWSLGRCHCPLFRKFEIFA